MEAAPDFALQVTQNGLGPVVRLAGDLDLAAAGQFRECLHQLVGETVTLDFTDVTFMDSTAIGVLVAVLQRSDRAGGSLVMHGVQPAQMKLLELTGVAELLTFDGDRPETEPDAPTS